MLENSSQLNLSLQLHSRIDVETTTLIALRDAVGIALKDPTSATYKETMRLGAVLDNYLFHRDRSVLQQQWDSPEEKECKAIANTTGTAFEQAVRQEIARYEELYRKSTGEDARLFEKKLHRLKLILQENRTDRFYEGKLIERDANIGSLLPMSRQGNGYRDFALPAERGMRIRITHETEIEAIIGTDLIYEHHDTELHRARLAVVQYKIMEKERYISKTDQFEKQISRMGEAFCTSLPCKLGDRVVPTYRLPTCSAFLRSTHRLQSSNPKVMSTGFYIPICRVSEAWSAGQQISESTFDGELVRYRVFEELLNTTILGSRWVEYADLEQFYERFGILKGGDTVIMHCQVYDD